MVNFWSRYMCPEFSACWWILLVLRRMFGPFMWSKMNDKYFYKLTHWAMYLHIQACFILTCFTIFKIPWNFTANLSMLYRKECYKLHLLNSMLACPLCEKFDTLICSYVNHVGYVKLRIVIFRSCMVNHEAIWSKMWVDDF